MKKIILMSIVLVSLFSCGNKNKPNYSSQQELLLEKRYVDSAKLELTKRNSYQIISEKEHVDPIYGYNKCNINVELNEKISKDDLIYIANQIRETRKSYDKLWIFYNIKGTYSGSVCWATTHFTPNLEVCINGSTKEEDNKYKSTSIDKNVIGKWILNGGYSYMLILYKKENTLYMKKQFNDGGNISEKFVKSTINGVTCYKPKINPEHLYYIIDSNGNLNLYGEHGKFADANKIE